MKRVVMSGALAVSLVAVGAVLLLLSRITDAAGSHAFNHGHAPPAKVHVTAGREYQISTKGGVPGLARVGLTVDTLNCTLTTTDNASQQLTLTKESADSKETHLIARFIAPVTGQVRVACDKLGTVYVDDADNATWDVAGLLAILATIALTLGVPLTISWLYRRGGRQTQQPEQAVAGDDSHIATGE